ncbi:MAG: hypothetical protein ACFFFG_12280 [Candidatus Thorarchaeota archaeon]
MSESRFSSRMSIYIRPFLAKLRRSLSELVSLIVEFKSALLVLLMWVILGGFVVVRPQDIDSTGFFPADVFLASLTFLVSLLGSILELILYPIDLVTTNKPFDETTIPEIFILLIPLVILIVGSFLIMVWTED